MEQKQHEMNDTFAAENDECEQRMNYILVRLIHSENDASFH